ncbi:mg15 protein [Tupanvirus deep ocean]|uniref:Mg15 protein n=2 Tax=Tupanvirus TaxID=2094720 RepID=A0AC62A995_9VIRU|nr:mg15 protein [Tupanvirus deep ocean]QKU34346.1 mg15 protein [Tupanvirus deep ocean]
MTVHKCPKCHKEFQQKSHLNDHLNRKNPCNEKENQKNKCQYCNKSYSRKYTLDRHIKSIHDDIIKQADHINAKNSHVYQNNNSGDVIINNINNNNNYFVLCPFSQEEIDKLSTDDKLCIFDSGENPIIMIVIKTNINPETKEYHNVGYTDDKSGHGYIFNGKTWIKKDIQSIVNEMLNSKQRDLLKIHEEIKDFLPEKERKLIENKLIEIRDSVEPKLETHLRSKKRLVTNLKNQLYSNRHLVQESIKRSGKPIVGIEPNNKRRNIIGNMSIEEFDKLLKQKKMNDTKLNLKRELAKDLLSQIDEIKHKDYDLLVNIIDKTSDLNEINIIMRLINKAYCFGDTINSGTIEKQIKKEAEIDKIVFNNEL